ncbi:protein C1orf194 homolog [Callorhinchus milii]|uniref:Uncharacterized protein n=1 Tax=Callorhinchus milii TaxID=7868 RepID=A0A4W3GUZ7_CALMI|nr:protein C1orf194 homolog [Callorhinchus milii]|eukprot:gi/632953540/ref/XP_007892473.1/ PREDICTED: uncharacterized protein C1orf194 homolog [Callorhinchus milii]
MPPTRDPYPFPRFENDDDFRGPENKVQPKRHGRQSRFVKQDGPWNRVHFKETITGRQAPRDSLDIHLSSVYDHNNDFLKKKKDVVYQKESCVPYGGCKFMKKAGVREEYNIYDEINREKYPDVGLKLETSSVHLRAKTPPRCWVAPRRESFQSVEGSIGTQHTAATNKGYSRKFDGGYFFS